MSWIDTWRAPNSRSNDLLHEAENNADQPPGDSDRGARVVRQPQPQIFQPVLDAPVGAFVREGRNVDDAEADCGRQQSNGSRRGESWNAQVLQRAPGGSRLRLQVGKKNRPASCRWLHKLLPADVWCNTGRTAPATSIRSVIKTKVNVEFVSDVEDAADYDTRS